MGLNERLEGEVALSSRQGGHNQSSNPIYTGLLHECIQVPYRIMQGYQSNDQKILVGPR